MSRKIFHKIFHLGLNLTIHLEDHGQDFLEWDIEPVKEPGVAWQVTDARPFQNWVWAGTKVHNLKIEAGDFLAITPSGLRTVLKYPVERVEGQGTIEAIGYRAS